MQLYDAIILIDNVIALGAYMARRNGYYFGRSKKAHASYQGAVSYS